ncbi:hypothetical protein [Chitinophaga ginsengisoli]|uniref:Uncharacterized protein n=1 Tax=Chitinophaga ginsengisoli TaxID=363837 RepID=A0A2P8FGQ2_9BACT|nr:hypothetical protein [Chitinophaga ginsengisoli]PSL20877.1 hypothetical protein CLV42_12453 [Chitinophaga ginsengisoli]
MILEFTVKADAAQPVLVVVNNVNVNLISPTETEVLIVRTDSLPEKEEEEEEEETTEGKMGAEPQKEAAEED